MAAFALSEGEALDYPLRVELLGASDWSTRAQALAFFQREGEKALDALVEGATHPNWRVRRGCADLMDHLADDRCTAPLVHLLHDPVAAVRRLAVHALSCQGCKRCPLNVDVVAHLLERASADSSVRVRRVAVHQLGCQPADARAIKFLGSLLERENDAGLVSRARWSLAKQQSCHAPDSVTHPSGESGQL